jgi:hypothetical protein
LGDWASKLLRARGGGGGGMTERRLLFVAISKLLIEGGLPVDDFLDKPRAGGGAVRDIVDAEGDGATCDEVRRIDADRRDGGGGGALPLSERGLPASGTSNLPFPSSSTFGESLPELLLFSFESVTKWLCLRVTGGAGRVFSFIADDDGEGGSGIFPADSLSNTDSRSESWLRRFGAGGSGLLRSVCDGSDGTGLGSI